jgi:DtxR family Mn-dependent transcriptional regulator
MPSEQVENYLKNIYKLQEKGGKVTTSSLSEKLQISAASVSEMIRKLAEEGTLRHTPYKGVELTPEGRKKALRIIRRHRLWEVFLVEVLKYDWDEIDEEAERLEHITSGKLEERLDKALGYPTHDPHGDIIPTADGKLKQRNDIPLSAASVGRKVSVTRVSDTHPEVLQYAARLGILLGEVLHVMEKVDFDGSMKISVGKKEQFVTQKLADNIFVRPLNA